MPWWPGGDPFPRYNTTGWIGVADSVAVLGEGMDVDNDDDMMMEGNVLGGPASVDVRLFAFGRKG